MADLIDRQAAIDIVVFECGEWTGLAKEINKQLRQLPSAQPDAVPVVHGRWIDEHYYSEHKSEHVYRCSECGWHMIAYPDELFHYCPICGARMDAEEKTNAVKP